MGHRPEHQGEASTIQGFLDLLARIDLADVVVLSALMIFDFSFWDTCLWGSDDDRAREAEVQGILFPSIAADYGMYCRSRGLDPSRTPIDKTWRNAKCDVQMMWAHLHHGRDVFVTSDDNFHKESKQPALIALGAGRILTPPDAATLTAS